MGQRAILYILALVVVVSLVLYAITFTVRFNEAAVKTRFGSANADSIKRTPGLHFKSPLDQVTSYDTRLRYTEAKLETQQTADSRQIIVQGYCTWRVEDPLKFFQRFSNAGSRAEDHFRSADDTVRSTLRSAMGAVSRFRMDELFTSAQGGTKLPDLEKMVLDGLSSGGSSGAAGATGAEALAYMGIKAVDVGISQVVLPAETTQKVFEKMTASRDALAKRIASQGEAEATAIKSKAEQDASRIMSFAEARAKEIRKQGDAEATQYFALMNKNPELAVFLQNVELLRSGIGRKGTTLVLPTSLPGMDIFGPKALQGLEAGRIPSVTVEGPSKPKAAEPQPAAARGTEGGR